MSNDWTDPKSFRIANDSLLGYALEWTREIERIQKLYQPYVLELTRTLESTQVIIQENLKRALMPLQQPLGGFAEQVQSMLGNLERERRLVSQALQQSDLGTALAALKTSQQQAMSYLSESGISKAIESISSANRQWHDLAEVAGLGSQITTGTFESVIALQRGLSGIHGFEELIPGSNHEAALDLPQAITFEKIQAGFHEALQKELPPLLAKLRTNPSRQDWLTIIITILIILEKLLSVAGNLASIDGWRNSKFPKQNSEALNISSEESKNLREAITAVMALSQCLVGAERLLSRQTKLLKSPKGASLGRPLPTGTSVRVLEEHHEWLLVQVEIEGEWRRGWIMKKYTTKRDQKSFKKSSP